MEYIEREALLDEINIAPVSMSICMNVDECKGRIYERERLVRIINGATAADVVPVRHGRWIPVKGYTGIEAFGFKEEAVENLRCSVCGKEIDVSEGWAIYCPNCGAIMDKDGDADV